MRDALLAWSPELVLGIFVLVQLGALVYVALRCRRCEGELDRLRRDTSR